MLSRKIQLFCVDGTPAVIVRALYPGLLTVSCKVRLYFRNKKAPFQVPCCAGGSCGNYCSLSAHPVVVTDIIDCYALGITMIQVLSMR